MEIQRKMYVFFSKIFPMNVRKFEIFVLALTIFISYFIKFLLAFAFFTLDFCARIFFTAERRKDFCINHLMILWCKKFSDLFFRIGPCLPPFRFVLWAYPSKNPLTHRPNDTTLSHLTTNKHNKKNLHCTYLLLCLFFQAKFNLLRKYKQKI